MPIYSLIIGSMDSIILFIVSHAYMLVQLSAMLNWKISFRKLIYPIAPDVGLVVEKDTFVSNIYYKLWSLTEH